jgi:predicted DNA binding CopG/RHH family protein
MCYSALVKQDLKYLGRRYGALAVKEQVDSLFGLVNIVRIISARKAAKKEREDTMKKEYKLKKLTKRPGKTKVDPDAVKVPISLRLDATVLGMLKTESDKRGLPYQTLIGSILHQFVHGELIDRKTIEILKKLKAS